MRFFALTALSLLQLACLAACHSTYRSPTVVIANGTIQGRYDSAHHQDLFLGIPYAEPPVGKLRFARPQPLKHKWFSRLSATEYSPFCMGSSINLVGFSQPSITYPEDEDCLTINVIRPSARYVSPLPVLVWIHGGGFQEGGSGDRRYNLSYLVHKSGAMSTPIIGVSFNYRLGVFGFISGQPFRDQKRTNLGLHDQRLALRWVRKNIGRFGGDPRRVTIHGESAGALSVGIHLLAYGGRDEGLFHGAIAQSGGPFYHMPFASETAQDSQLEALQDATGCSGGDVISCLGAIPAKALRDASRFMSLNPIVDHDILVQLNSVALRNGAFVRVPLLIGANTNEGTPFAPLLSPIGANSTDDAVSALLAFTGPGRLSNETVQRFGELYWDLEPAVVKAELGTVLVDPGEPYGPFYGVISLLAGDLSMAGGRRIAAEWWARHGVNAYSYRFDTVPAGISPEILGAAHFQEVAFVFGNTGGEGYELDPFNASTAGEKDRLLDLSNVMSRMWISFVNTGSPNHHGGRLPAT